ncbi:methyltransferase [Seiridium cupressi]
MGRKKRVNRSVMEPGARSGCASTQRDYEPIMGVLEVDQDNPPEEFSSEYPSTGGTSFGIRELEIDKGLGQPEWNQYASSLYAPSCFPASLVDRGPPRPFDDGATVNSNRSIAPSDVEYVWEHGRRYCGSYYMPNDKLEQTRLLLVHEVYKSAFNDEPTSVPLENPTMVLDVGAGTGEWAIDMADRYSDCEVTGIDIADIFPTFVAPNLFWEIDNAELEWLRPTDSYDLVHFRNMAGAFKDWPFVYGQAFKVCKSGGWVELLDYDDVLSSGNFFSFIPLAESIHHILRDYAEASAETGYRVDVTHLEPQLLRDAGFVGVALTERAIPISPKEMSTGHLFLKSLLEGLEAHSLRLLTKYKGYSAEEVRTAIANLSEDFKKTALDRERSKGFAVKIKVLTGRKPSSPGWWESQLAPNDSGKMDVDEQELPRN